MTAPGELQRLIALATTLIEQIGDIAARDEANYRRGWQAAAPIFFQHGVDVGRAQLDREQVDHAQRAAAEYLDRVSSPRHAELCKRRWGGRRQDFGRPRPGDFPGRGNA